MSLEVLVSEGSLKFDFCASKGKLAVSAFSFH